MKRITLILGVVAVMVAMLVALAAPAMAKDNGGHNNRGGHNNGGINRLDNRLDRVDNRLDNRVDLDGDFLASDGDRSPVFTTNNALADDLCSPLSSDAINNTIPGCIFGDRNDDLNTGFVSDVDFDTVDFVDVDRDLGFTNGNNHNSNANHNGNGNGHHNGGGGHNNGKEK
jgi:hypothetical protein